MPDQESRSARYRCLASECLEIAQHIPFRDDRERMMQMAQQWLEFAEKAEREEPPSS